MLFCSGCHVMEYVCIYNYSYVTPCLYIVHVMLNYVTIFQGKFPLKLCQKPRKKSHKKSYKKPHKIYRINIFVILHTVRYLTHAFILNFRGKSNWLEAEKTSFLQSVQCEVTKQSITKLQKNIFSKASTIIPIEEG